MLGSSSCATGNPCHPPNSIFFLFKKLPGQGLNFIFKNIYIPITRNSSPKEVKNDCALSIKKGDILPGFRLIKFFI